MHVLTRFLFTYEQVRQPIATLSGGERTRLQLLLLMRGGANCLVLDEPTNHLDIDCGRGAGGRARALRRHRGRRLARPLLPRPHRRPHRRGARRRVHSFEGGYSAWNARREGSLMRESTGCRRSRERRPGRASCAAAAAPRASGAGRRRRSGGGRRRLPAALGRRGRARPGAGGVAAHAPPPAAAAARRPRPAARLPDRRATTAPRRSPAGRAGDRHPGRGRAMLLRQARPYARPGAR